MGGHLYVLPVWPPLVNMIVCVGGHLYVLPVWPPSSEHEALPYVIFPRHVGVAEVDHESSPITTHPQLKRIKLCHIKIWTLKPSTLEGNGKEDKCVRSGHSASIINNFQKTKNIFKDR